MQSSSTERASTGVGRGTGPPRDAGALLDGGGQMEMGGCVEAGGGMSTGGWQGSRDAVAMSCCRICPSAAARARLRVGSLHSPAQKWFAEAQPLCEIPWLPSQPLTASRWGQALLEAGDTQQGHPKGPRQRPGVLLAPFAGREMVGTKKNNEQRWWAGSPRVSPHSKPALCTPLCCLCFSLCRWRWLSQPESWTKSWTTSHHPAEIWLCTRSLCRGRKDEATAA